MDGVALDVTRERASAEQFQRLFQLSNDLILAYDRGLVIRLINPAVRTLLGYEPEEVIGREWSVLVHPDDAIADYEQGGADFAQQTREAGHRPLHHEGRSHPLVLVDGRLRPRGRPDALRRPRRDGRRRAPHRDGAPVAHRLADRAREPPAPRRRAARRARPGDARGTRAGRGAARPRPVQDRQRHPRPSGRRCGADRRRAAAAPVDPVVRHGRPLGWRGVLRDPAGPRVGGGAAPRRRAPARRDQRRTARAPGRSCCSASRAPPAARWRSPACGRSRGSSTPPTARSTRPSGAAATRRGCSPS